MASYQARRNYGGGGSQQPQIRSCKYCNGKIMWKEDPSGATRDDGTPKNLPYDASPPYERHKCQQFKQQQTSSSPQQYKEMPNRDKSKGIRCRICNDGTMIMFSDDQKSKSGKFIPLEMTGEPHQHREQREEQENDSRPYGTAGRQLSREQAEQEGFNE
jgi:DNA-directed RNA polymerase subunit RPC12/RpoP